MCEGGFLTRVALPATSLPGPWSRADRGWPSNDPLNYLAYHGHNTVAHQRYPLGKAGIQREKTRAWIGDFV